MFAELRSKTVSHFISDKPVRCIEPERLFDEGGVIENGNPALVACFADFGSQSVSNPSPSIVEERNCRLVSHDIKRSVKPSTENSARSAKTIYLSRSKI